MGFKYTEAAVDRIPREVEGDQGELMGGQFKKTISQKQNNIGRWWNPIAMAGEGATKQQRDRVHSVLNDEVNDKQNYRYRLRTTLERNLYDTIRQSLLDNANHRIAINEPVYRDGQPTPPGIDPYYYPTTTEPRVADIFRQNTNTREMDRLKNDFLQHQAAHGFNPTEANQNFSDMIDSFQGTALRSSHDHANFFNAARKAQGIPLPESWQRQDLMRNMEAYFRRMSADNAYYEHVERDPRMMASLGYTKDPWNNPINQPNFPNKAGVKGVEAVMSGLRGEHVVSDERTSHAIESLATTMMLGP
jgi:hypothetical protein